MIKNYVYIRNAATSCPLLNQSGHAIVFANKAEGELYLKAHWGKTDGKLCAPYTLRPLTNIDEILWPPDLRQRYGRFA